MQIQEAVRHASASILAEGSGRLLALLASAVAVASCDNGAPTQMLLKDGGRPVPGKYLAQSVATVTEVGSGSGEITREDTLCLNASTPTIEAAVKREFRRCSSGEVRTEAGKITGTMICDVADVHPKDVSIQFSGSYSKTSIDLVLEFSVPGAQVRQVRPFRRVGPC